MTTVIDLQHLVDPTRFAHGYPHDTWTALRRHSPVHWCEIDGYDPFWAVTRHADVKHVSCHPHVFSYQKRLVLAPSREEREIAGSRAFRTVLNTDPPERPRSCRATAGSAGATSTAGPVASPRPSWRQGWHGKTGSPG